MKLVQQLSSVPAISPFQIIFSPKIPENPQKTKIHCNEIDILEDTKMSRSEVGFTDSGSVTAYICDTPLH